MKLAQQRGKVAAASLALAAASIFAASPPAQAAGPPQIDAAWSTGVAAASATLHAQVNPNALATNVRFEYLTEAAYQANLGAAPPRDGFFGAARAPLSGLGVSIGSGTSDAEVIQQLSTLVSNTTYRYRVTATSSAAPGGLSGPPHAFTSEETAAVFSLPDGRGWELVSPLDKNGGEIQGAGQSFGGGVLQAAAQGGAITYSSVSSFDGGQGAPSASQYLASRAGSGWATQNITTPALSGSYGDDPNGVPYQLFSTDLRVGLLSNGERCRTAGFQCPVANPPLPGSGAPSGYRNYYLTDNTGGGFGALLSAANTQALTLPAERFEVRFVTATPDLAQIVLSSCAGLSTEATEVPGSEGCDPAEPNLYQWSGGALGLINLLPGEAKGTPGATLAAQSGAISADGRRVYFTDQGNLYLREANSTVQVDGAAEVGGGGTFQTASTDGSVAFFTKAAHLYRYDVGSKATTDLTPAGEVLGVLGASGDGSYLYYESTAGLFLRHGATTTPIASSVLPANYPPTTGTARVSADGTHLAFSSSASLSGYDNVDANTRAPDAELFVYDAPSNQLSCASCNPTGERPIGSSSIPGASPNGKAPGSPDSYKPRALSADGGRLFFDSADSLALADTNNRPDVYEWQAQGTGGCQKSSGCIGLLSSGRSAEASTFVDASASGADAFFLTAASLVPSDPGSYDLYDAREGGGFAAPPIPIACEGDACQSLPSPPEDPTPGTLVRGEGNPPARLSKPKKHHRKHHKKHHPKGKGQKRRGPK